MRLNPFVGALDSGPGHPEAIEVDSDLATRCDRAEAEADAAIWFAPFKQPGGYERARGFLRFMFCERQGGRGRRENVAAPFTLELVHDRETRAIRFRYVARDAEQRRRIVDGLRSYFEDATVSVGSPGFVGFTDGDHVATARLAHVRDGPDDHLLPVNTRQEHSQDFVNHPYNGITKAMSDPEQDGGAATTVIQITLKPALSSATQDDLNWHHGAKERAERLREPSESWRVSSIFEELLSAFGLCDPPERYTKRSEPSQDMLDAAETVEAQANKLGYHLNVRLMALSQDPEVAEARVVEMAEKYKTFYHSAHGQGLRRVVPEGSDRRVQVGRMAGRMFDPETAITVSLDEASELASVPTDAPTDGIEYTRRRSDAGSPPGTPQLDDYEEAASIGDDVQTTPGDSLGPGPRPDTDDTTDTDDTDDTGSTTDV